MQIRRSLPSGVTLMAEVTRLDDEIGQNLLGRLILAADGMTGGESIATVDWARLRLRRNGEDIHVEEPDYGGAGDAFVPSLLRTARLFAYQDQLSRQLGIVAQPPAASDSIETSEAALRAISCIGTRRGNALDSKMGWRLVPEDDPECQDSGLYLIDAVARVRLPALAALALPPGWGFGMAGNTITQCVTPDGKTRSVFLSVDV